ncbi:MAG: CRISPR-associated endonuclease Cas1 [Candidatus Methylacidiphilales bacterium]
MSRLTHPGFTLLHCGNVETRSLEILSQERPWPVLPELCLDFQTALVVDETPEGMPLLTIEKFVRILAARLKQALGVLPATIDPAPVELEMLTWFLRKTSPEVRYSVSQPGHREILKGLTGPLFLRGDLQAIWPVLIVAEELHIGRTLAAGAGRFLIRPSSPLLDTLLLDTAQWQRELERLKDDPEHTELWNGPRVPDIEEMAQIVNRMRDGVFPSEPAHRIEIPKSSGEVRVVGRLEPATFLLHRVLSRVLSKPLEARLSNAVIAFRPGRSTELVRPFLSHAIDAGCTHVARTDVQSFDDIDWSTLEETLDRFLPKGDTLVRGGVRAAWSIPFRDMPRHKGVLQGSPLSPQLSNLFLAAWDEAMAARGHRHLRYGDDLIIAAQSESDAGLVLADAAHLLADFGLRLNPEKTAILSIADGFRHLGLDLGGHDGDIVETAKPSPRRTLYLTRAEEWAGLDHGAILMRDGSRLIRRLPLHQISNIVFFGIGGVSTGLISACMYRSIPLTFADHAGHHTGTLHPEARAFYAAVARHAEARKSLRSDAVAAVAREIVGEKLVGYLAWADSLLPPVSGLMRKAVETGRKSLAEDREISSTLGIEGAAARALFRIVNGLCAEPFWGSERRLPHERKDPWNTLIDTLSFLLFVRINMLIRANGLDPYQGFLHSPSGRFESLVCDVQEPFRARLERLAVRLANLKIIRQEHAFQQPDQTWSWTQEGWRTVIHEFETELDRRRGKAPVTWRTAIHYRVDALKLWVSNAEERQPWPEL